jgi:hypothetical protein
MNIDELSKMSEEELHLRANIHLEKLDKQFVSEMQKEHHVSQAQFYLAELERRVQAKERIESERIGKRDYRLELWVIGLIGAELVLAVVGIVFGWVEGNKQTKVLDQLNQSSAATAATLTALRQAQEASLETQRHTLENITAMNDALQDELDLNLTEAMQYSGGMTGGGHERVDFSNSSRTVLWLCGSKFGTEPTAMRKRPTMLTPGSSAPFEISDLIAKTIKAMGTTTEATVPFELYLKRENGTKYVAKGTVQVNRNNNVNFIGRMTTTRKQW